MLDAADEPCFRGRRAWRAAINRARMCWAARDTPVEGHGTLSSARNEQLEFSAAGSCGRDAHARSATRRTGGKLTARARLHATARKTCRWCVPTCSESRTPSGDAGNDASNDASAASAKPGRKRKACEFCREMKRRCGRADCLACVWPRIGTTAVWPCQHGLRRTLQHSPERPSACVRLRCILCAAFVTRLECTHA
jgi:hypothetical protein